ncbi:MAG TPA: pyridoxamine 5'-phosphate oxidase family protein, partial [Leptospiraceae bacterium]|nr:pyridoxamine 5'-phosphate oxidase family protein [Leptospiraceae bacterium]
GRKMTEMKANEKVSFAIADEYSIIPSYFTDPKFACPATSFFKSVIAYGVLEIIEDLDEKVLALTAFMEKLQPEGGYSPFNLEDLEYKKQIKGVNVLRLTPSSISAKFKFGQNRKEEEWNKTVDGLIKRNNPRDSEIVDAMKQYCPF